MRTALQRRAGAAIGAIALVAAASLAFTTQPTADMHLALDRSSPEADEMLMESPSEITLWFTQAPQMAGTSVRLLPKGGEPLELGDATALESDAKVVVLEVTEPLATGEYQVLWRAMASDGHVVRGDFGFMVHATR